MPTVDTCVCWVITGCSTPGAHLDRLLHQIVEPPLLERREAIDEIGRGGCGRVCLTGEPAPPSFVVADDPRQPFAVATVEDEQLGAFAQRSTMSR